MTTERKTILEEIQGTVDEMLRQIKKLIKEGNARRVIIQNKDGKTLFQSQLTIGVAGTTLFVLYAPILTAITTFVLYFNDVRVLVERDAVNSDSADEHEVEAEVIEIKDDDDEEEGKEEAENQDEKKASGKKADKTVGKEKKE